MDDLLREILDKLSIKLSGDILSSADLSDIDDEVLEAFDDVVHWPSSSEFKGLSDEDISDMYRNRVSNAMNDVLTSEKDSLLKVLKSHIIKQIIDSETDEEAIRNILALIDTKEENSPLFFSFFLNLPGALENIIFKSSGYVGADLEEIIEFFREKLDLSEFLPDYFYEPFDFVELLGDDAIEFFTFISDNRAVLGLSSADLLHIAEITNQTFLIFKAEFGEIFGESTCSLLDEPEKPPTQALEEDPCTTASLSTTPLPPDWTSADTDRVYYNEDTCSYCLVYKTTYIKTGGPDLENRKEESKIPAAQKILDLLNKEYTEEEFTDIISSVTVKNYYLSPKPFIKMIFLVEIPAGKIKDLKTIEVKEQEEGTFVEYYALDSFSKNIEILATKLRFYQSQYVAAIFRGGPQYENLNFFTEADYLFLFRENLVSLMAASDANPDEYLDLGIEFVLGSYEIKSIFLAKTGFLNKELMNGFQEFSTSEPQNRSTTMNFISKLSDIIFDIQSQSYDKFVDKYYYPTIIARPPADPTDSNALLKKIGSLSKDLLTSETLYAMSSTPCLTQEEVDKRNKQIRKEDSDGKLGNFADKYSISVEDAFFASMPDILKRITKEQGKGALNALGREFLGKLGVCGLGDILGMLANTAFSFLSLAEYKAAIAECALSNLKMEWLEKSYPKLLALDNGFDINAKYTEIVGDYLLPWEYLPQDYRAGRKSGGAVYSIGLIDGSAPLETPTTQYSQGDAPPTMDAEIRFRALKDAISLTIDINDLFDYLKNLPGNGWMKFLVEGMQVALESCEIPTIGTLSIGANWCKETPDGKKKKISFPKIPELKNTPSALDFIVNSALNLIINLAVKTITEILNNIFQQLASSISGTKNFSASGAETSENTPPIYINEENYFRNKIKDASPDLTEQQISEIYMSVLAKVFGQQISVSQITTEEMVFFLDTGLSQLLNEFEKINLLEGGIDNNVFEAMLDLVENTSLANYFSKKSNIVAYFQELSIHLDIDEINDDFLKSLQAPVSTPYDGVWCTTPDSGFSNALATKDDTASEEQQSEILNQKKDAAKKQLCDISQILGSSNPLFGKLNEQLFGENGLLSKQVSKVEYNFIKKGAEIILEAINISYRGDLFGVEGLINIILHDPNWAIGNYPEFRVPEAESETLALYDMQWNLLKHASIFIGHESLLGEGYNIHFTFGDPYHELKFIENYTQDSSTSSAFTTGTVTVPARVTLESLFQPHQPYRDPDTLISLSNLPNDNIYDTPSTFLRILIEDKLGFLEEEVRSNFIDIYISDDGAISALSNVIKFYFSRAIYEAQNKSLAFTYENWRFIAGTLNSPSRTRSILGLSTVMDDLEEFYQRLKEDERIYASDRSQIVEPPFNRVLKKLHVIQNYPLVLTLFRIYVLEFIYKSLYFFKTFSIDFFNKEIISKYIAINIMKDLEDLLEEEEYYNFLEIAVQMYTKKIEAGLGKFPSINATRAIETINEKIIQWVDGGMTKNKKEIIASTTNQIEIVIAAILEENFPDILEDLKSALPPVYPIMSPFIFKFIEGSLIGDDPGPRNVASDVDNYQYSLADLSPGQPNGFLILEKYIYIEDKDSPIHAVKTRPENLFGVVNLYEWEEWVKKSGLSGSISDYWKSWRYGLRICMNTKSSDGDDLEIPIEERQNNKSFIIQNSDGTSMLSIPVVDSRIEIPVNTQITDIKESIVDEYDVGCLVLEMSDSFEFKNLLSTCIALPRLISLITIYSVDNSIESLLTGMDKNISSPVQEWWIRGAKTFENTKRQIIETILGGV